MRQRILMLALLLSSIPASLTAGDFSVAMVDVLRIFRELPRISNQMDEVKKQTLEIESTIQVRQIEIEGVQRKLQAPLLPADREKLTLQLSKLQTELRLYVERERQNIDKRNLSIQIEFYKEISAEVKKIAEEKGYKLVMVRPKFPLEGSTPQQQATVLNQIFIYEDPTLDITDSVLEKLKNKSVDPESTNKK